MRFGSNQSKHTLSCIIMTRSWWSEKLCGLIRFEMLLWLWSWPSWSFDNQFHCLSIDLNFHLSVSRAMGWARNRSQHQPAYFYQQQRGNFWNVWFTEGGWGGQWEGVANGKEPCSWGQKTLILLFFLDLSPVKWRNRKSTYPGFYRTPPINTGTGDQMNWPCWNY